MDFETLKNQIMGEGELQALRLATNNSVGKEAEKIKKKFKLSGFWGTMSIIFKKTFPPGYFAAAGVLLDAYPASLAANMVCFHFYGGLQGNMMMFLEDIERVEANRMHYLGHALPGRIERAAEVIARILCMMPDERLAQRTYRHMISPTMKERVRVALFALDHDVATKLTQ